MNKKNYLVVWKRRDEVNVSATEAESARLATENVKRGRIGIEILSVWEETEESWK